MTEAKTIGWLEGLTDNVKGKRLEMRGDSFLVGRGSTSDIQLEDPQVSREHARLSYAEGQLRLEDLGSTHGTFVNGDPIKTSTLKNGDRIRFGGSLFHLHVAKGVIAEAEPGQDDIATVMATEDEIATQLASEDEIATQLASEDDVSTVLSKDSDQLVDEPAATVRARSVDTPAVTPPAPTGAPVVAPPVAPTPVSDLGRKGLPGWLIAVFAALAVVVVLGVGLVLAITVLGGEPETPPAVLVEPAATQEGFTRELVATPTSTQLSKEPTATVEVPVTDEQAPAATEPVVAAELPTETAPTDGPSPMEPTQKPSGAAVLGGASGIAFASDRSGYPQIYYLDLASREVSPLTDEPNGACQPAWSPDGQRLAYTSPCGSNREAYTGSTIFIMDVDSEGNPGTAQPLMVSLGGGDYAPDWSPDGGRIAFTSQRTGRPQVFTAALDGQELFNVNDDLAHNWNPAWSGDGLQIAFLTGRGGAEEIWLVPAGGGEEARFSRSDGKDVAKPDWSPDGATIIFEKVVGSIPRIVAAPVSEGGVRVVQVCQEGPLSLQPMGEPAWSPDGNWLAFETWPGGGDHKIGIMQVSCTGYEELTSDPSLDFDAAWRPVP